MTADLLWVRESVLPPAYRTETDWSCACQIGPCFPCTQGECGRCDTATGLGIYGMPQRETELWGPDGRSIAENRALVVVWLADRACRARCSCSCREGVAS